MDGGTYLPAPERAAHGARIGGLTARQRAMHFGDGRRGWPPLGANPLWAEELARLNGERIEAETLAYQRALSGKPAWWFDRGFINGVALEFLPRVAASLGYTLACAAWEPGQVAWWPDGEPGHVVMVAGADGAVAYVDRASGYWITGGMEARGADLIELAAPRWRVSEAKAAWRLAKLCGLRRPHQ